LLGTNPIHDFRAAIFTAKSGFVREILHSSVKSVMLRKFQLI